MKVATLMVSLGSTVRPVVTGDDEADVNEVVLDDARTPLGPGQVVVAVRNPSATDLWARAEAAGCAAVVVPDQIEVTPTGTDGLHVVQSVATSPTQMFVLLRTMLLTSHDELAEGTVGPSSVHGVADAIGVMMRGTVVLYDRAHRVIAYSVQGHGIDRVRRDAILDRRTPEQWIRRFTIDRTAYETYADPGRVVRVESYADLRPRLRIAVRAGNDILGEISVAEGDEGFADDAEDQLRRAADLAVPAMLWHRRASDLDAVARDRSMRSLLYDGAAAAGDPLVQAMLDDNRPELRVVGFADHSDSSTPAQEAGAERVAHFLRLHVRSLHPGADVIYADRRFYAVIPPCQPSDIDQMLNTVLRQLDAMRLSATVAISAPETEIKDLPRARLVVEALLELSASAGSIDRILHAEDKWAELTLFRAVQAVAEESTPCAPLRLLEAFDRAQAQDLVGTLGAYLEHNGSVSAAASALFLHANTMRHRLSRISEVAGLDLDDPLMRIAIALQLRARGA